MYAKYYRPGVQEFLLRRRYALVYFGTKNTFINTRCITSKRVTSWRGPSPQHNATCIEVQETVANRSQRCGGLGICTPELPTNANHSAIYFDLICKLPLQLPRIR